MCIIYAPVEIHPSGTEHQLSVWVEMWHGIFQLQILTSLRADFYLFIAKNKNLAQVTWT